MLCGIHLRYVFPLNTYTAKRISQRSAPDCANKKKQQREGLSETGRHTHFLRTRSQGPWDQLALSPKQGAPPSKDLPVLKSGGIIKQ